MTTEKKVSDKSKCGNFLNWIRKLNPYNIEIIWGKNSYTIRKYIIQLINDADLLKIFLILSNSRLSIHLPIMCLKSFDFLKRSSVKGTERNK